MEIPSLSAEEARALFNANITTVHEVTKQRIDRLFKIFLKLKGIR